MVNVVKRDCTEVSFDKNKIYSAIMKAMKNGSGIIKPKIAENIADEIENEYIKRVSILGGEPLSRNNCYEIFLLVSEIKNKFPDKKIWIYSGYSYEKFSREQLKAILKADVLIDGEYIEELKNPNLKFRGSLNQRVINIPETLKQNKVILYCD